MGSERSAVLEPERRLGGPVEGQRIGLDVLGFSIATNASIGQSKEDAEYQWIVTPGWWFCSSAG